MIRVFENQLVFIFNIFFKSAKSIYAYFSLTAVELGIKFSVYIAETITITNSVGCQGER